MESVISTFVAIGGAVGFGFFIFCVVPSVLFIKFVNKNR